MLGYCHSAMALRMFRLGDVMKKRGQRKRSGISGTNRVRRDRSEIVFPKQRRYSGIILCEDVKDVDGIRSAARTDVPQLAN